MELMCPVCKGGEYAYFNCYYPGCTDGRGLVPRYKTYSEKKQRLEELKKELGET